jgi:hypothetical protein
VPEPPSRSPSRSSERPTDLSLRELGFNRQKPVAWLSPGQLAGTAVRVVGAELFGAMLDKRELQAALSDGVFDHADGGELWFDYVADLGDGFDATYSVAWLLAQRELAVADPAGGPGVTLPRGRVLVMGGDEVYPTPSWRGYEDRTKGPYLAAMPERDEAAAPTLYALPGNHDWYDGLTAFLRLFGKGSWFGGWRTRQRRSYFALALPRRWFLFAIDDQLASYLDDPQLTYFARAAEQLRPGDRVILCTSRPTWVYGDREPHAYDTVDYFIRKVIEPTGAEIPVLLTGDMHHYARYHRANGPVTPTAGVADPAEDGAAPRHDDELPPRPGTPTAAAPGRTLVTCGGGGAYLYPTHQLPRRLSVPPEGTLRRGANPSEPYELCTTFPDRARSTRLAWGVFGRLLGRNPMFAGVLGLLHVLLMYAFITAGSRVLTAPVLALVAVVFGGSLGFAMSEEDIHRRLAHWLCGLGHAVGHLALAVLGALVWWQLPLAHLPGPLPVLLAIVVYQPVFGVLGAELTAGYLLVASMFHVNVNESFAGQGIDDHKSFLRLHIAADGTLTIYPIGLERVGRQWIAAPHDPTGTPWIKPVLPLRPQLIERPFQPGKSD